MIETLPFITFLFDCTNETKIMKISYIGDSAIRITIVNKM
ncbi:hypothetical protein APP_25070 [Aeribacillus pallidus]|nr:hypothetical protein APP_25070 [Aeribacillus pallidus]